MLLPILHHRPHHGAPAHLPATWRDVRHLLRRLLLLLLLAAMAAALAYALFRGAAAAADRIGRGGRPVGGSPASSGAYSELEQGYDGPPVVATVTGARTKALGGWCEVIVRDRSGSVVGDIDPAGQIDEELAAVTGALADGGLPTDRVAAVSFASSARASGVLAPSSPTILAVLNTDGNDLGGGTNITAGFEEAAKALASCPPGSSPHLTAITDGETSADDVRRALDTVDGIPVDVIALDDGGWQQTASAWARPDVTISRITRLDAGITANAMARIISERTGQTVLAGFAPNPTGGS